jgi:hypothetical protein
MGAQIRMMIHVQYENKSPRRWIESVTTLQSTVVQIRVDLCVWFGLAQLLKSVVVAVEHLLH